MRKILMPLLALVMMGLSSCNLDREDYYTYSYNLVFAVLDEDKEAIEAYFQDYISKHADRSFHGTYNLALSKGTEDFLKDLQDLDVEYVSSLLTVPDETVQLRYFMDSSNTSVLVGLQTWVYQDPQDQ